jgi:TrmH family RNA methyltransferase
MDVRLKRYHKDFEHSYAFGVFPTLELLHYQRRHVLKVLADTRGMDNTGVAKLKGLCERQDIPFEINDRLIERLAPMENCYAIGVFRKYTAPLNRQHNHVVLVNPSDMGNLGTIARTMVGFGVHDLALIRPAVDIFDPRVIRASMGAVFRLRFAYYDRFEDYRNAFAHTLYPFMTNAVRRLGEVSFQPPFGLVFGNESAGLPDEYLKAGESVVIPHGNEIDSLNLSVAVGIALYESTKGQF